MNGFHEMHSVLPKKDFPRWIPFSFCLGFGMCSRVSLQIIVDHGYVEMLDFSLEDAWAVARL